MIVRHIDLICVGTLKEAYLREGVREYQKRLGTLCKLQIVELEEARLAKEPGEREILQALEREGEAILARLQPDAFKVALCIEGRTLSSEGLSELLATAEVAGKSRFQFVIGGSYGLSETVKRACDRRLSVSPMTFPHQLFRLMWIEQLYRALMIRTGSRYHK